jgi:hypothetical protein
VLEPRALEFDMVIEMVKTHKSQGMDSSTVELITEGSRTIRCEIHKLINSVWSNSAWMNRPIYKNGDKTDNINYRKISHLLTMYKILSIICC